MDGATLLVTLGMDEASFGRLDHLRSKYFPPKRNVVPAYLCLFHKLPADREQTVRNALEGATLYLRPIPLGFGRLEPWATGMAVAVSAPGIARIYSWLNARFADWLTPQDLLPFWPHVTLMNRASRRDAARGFAHLSARWEPWNGTGESLQLWRRQGGPWEPVSEFRFRGGTLSPAAANA